MTELNLRYNALEGPIPPELGGLASLTRLNLWRNRLTGPIPPELGNLASLTNLWLSDNDLSGAIPPELGNLVSLRSLGLAGNNLTDTIPSQLGNLASLGQLALGANDLSGPVPLELGNLTGLWSLDLNYNDLSGSVPESFLGLDGLRHFNFDGNAGFCAPGTSAFVTWLERIENRDEGPYCNAADGGRTRNPLPDVRRFGLDKLRRLARDAGAGRMARGDGGLGRSGRYAGPHPQRPDRSPTGRSRQAGRDDPPAYRGTTPTFPAASRSR